MENNNSALLPKLDKNGGGDVANNYAENYMTDAIDAIDAIDATTAATTADTTRTTTPITPTTLQEITVPALKTWNHEIDIEFLLNKKRYNKYLTKNNPNKLKEMEENFKNKNLYLHRIMEVCENYLTNNSFEVSRDLDDLFDNFSTKLVQHFILKDYEKSKEADSYENDDSDTDADDDVMFSNNILVPTPPINYANSSLWGKQIRKTAK